MALQGVALADQVTNTLDNTIDTDVETMSLATGGPNGSTTLYISPTNGDNINGCNVKSQGSLTLNVQSSDTSIATVSPSSVTFTSCGVPGQALTVTPKRAGTATVAVSISANNTIGSFDLKPATFSVVVAGPANTAPTVTVTNVTDGAAYEFGNVPAAQCTATDKEDGTSTFAASLSAITGPRAADGLGSQTATCSYTDKGDASGANQLTATASATYTIEDTTKPTVTVQAPATTEATGALTPVAFAASAFDAVDGSLPAVCVSASGKTYASGDGFPVGTTSLTCSATDKSGNTGQAAPFDVVVTDTTAPSLATSADLVVPNTSGAGATVTYDAPTASDLVDGNVAASCTPASGTQFAMGTTTVTCSATDKAGNTGTSTFTVEVQDKTNPVVTVPEDVTVEASGPNGANVDYGAVTATDDVDGALPVSCDTPTGTFPLGTTTVTCSATDKSGNTGHNSFTVTVVDTTPPRLTVPDSLTKEATGPEGATVTFSASADDLVDGTVDATCTPASGSTFALGDTVVLCSATDKAGNTAQASFTVTVHDTTPPVVSVPDDVVAEATGPDGAEVSYGDASATDLVDGPGLSTTCSQASGTTFPLGATKVTCSATDAAGNIGEASFTVKVVDTTAPTVATPANLQVGNDVGAKGASSVTYGPATATDLVDGTDETSCTPASGSAFPLGITTVTCTATDKAGNTGSAQFTIDVQDQTKPIVYVPSTINASATGPDGATASWPSTAVYAVDDVDGPVPATCDKSPGDTFPLGTTTVTCTASDKAGNKAVNTFNVVVVDDKAPVLTVPADLTTAATSANGAVVSFTPATAVDNVDGSVPATCAPASGSVFPLGTTTVTCTAADKAGNIATKSFTVTVNAAWSGILQPVNADGSSIFKLGSTVPVKFALTGASAGIKDLDARLYYMRTGAAGDGTYAEAVSTSAATTGSAFRYDPTANQYIFNLATKTLSSGTYTLRLDLGDGVDHTVTITLK